MRVALIELRYERRTGRYRGRLVAACHRARPRCSPISGRVVELVDVAVPARPITRGETIGEEESDGRSAAGGRAAGRRTAAGGGADRATGGAPAGRPAGPRARARSRPPGRCDAARMPAWRFIRGGLQIVDSGRGAGEGPAGPDDPRPQRCQRRGAPGGRGRAAAGRGPERHAMKALGLRALVGRRCIGGPSLRLLDRGAAERHRPPTDAVADRESGSGARLPASLPADARSRADAECRGQLALAFRGQGLLSRSARPSSRRHPDRPGQHVLWRRGSRRRRLLPTLPVTDLAALPIGTPEQLVAAAARPRGRRAPARGGHRRHRRRHGRSLPAHHR